MSMSDPPNHLGSEVPYFLNQFLGLDHSGCLDYFAVSYSKPALLDFSDYVLLICGVLMKESRADF